jgi:tRNA-dihydrouridine synthase 3|tara:strand:- start:1411 stop:3246 length:1836 start_codon:yes stop_codon:yes gene_type:complete
MTTSTPTDDAPTTSTPTTPSSWTPPTARELFDAGSVVVRREFLSAPPPRAPARDDAEEGRPRGTFGGFTKRYKRENRDRRDGGAREVRLCHDFLRGACAFGEEKCKFSHDVDAYVKSKAPDLPGTCTFVNREGGCPYGVKCRYLGSHDGNAKEAEGETVALEPPKTVVAEMNFFDRDVMKRLRKKTYDFSRANTIVRDVLGQKMEDGGGDDAGGDDAGESAAKRAKKDDECTDTGAFTKTRPCEKKQIDFKDKLYLAPLTTVGNLPFRRLCKTLGADVTCGEMALATNLLQGQQGEWALLRRHTSEDIFGVQICGGYPDSVTRCCQLLEENIDVDFIDINMGCPIDMICQKGYGSMMLEKPKKMAHVIRAASAVLNKCSLTFKTRIAYNEKARVAHTISPKVAEWGAAAMTLHGRTRAQRYRSLADWEYIKLTKEVSSVPLIGNGDVYNQKDYYTHLEEHAVDTCMLARGALIKPWLFTEIKERRDWDISSSERFDIFKSFASYGLEHWGSDTLGVEQTRKYLLEWMSFTYRYTPIGLVDRAFGDVSMTQRPPAFVGRDDLETLMASPNAEDWVKISTMLLGPPPEGFKFQPKHKSNAYETGVAQGDMDQG